MDSAEVVTTDGAKGYDYFIELIGRDKTVHVICLQHKARNIRKRAAVKKIVEQLMAAEMDYLVGQLNIILDGKREQFKEIVEYILPKTLPEWLYNTLYNSGMAILEDFIERGREKYRDKIEEYMRVYETYIHHRLYVSEHAALVGRLRAAYKELRGEGEGDKMERGGAIKWANRVVYTTAMLEGLNRPLRNRIRRAIRYRDRKLTIAIGKLFLLQHNTLSRRLGSTPYEKINFPISEMAMNPFVRLYLANRLPAHSYTSDMKGVRREVGYRVREERYGSWYGTTKELRYPLIGLEGRVEEGLIKAVVELRDFVLGSIGGIRNKKL